MIKPLTAREREVLGLLAAGAPNPRIAEKLVITIDTVKTASATSSASLLQLTAPKP